MHNCVLECALILYEIVAGNQATRLWHISDWVHEHETLTVHLHLSQQGEGLGVAA
jgi:hypothetical protein